MPLIQWKIVETGLHGLLKTLCREIIRVSADTLTTNPASSRVLEKVGMKHEGCQRMKFHRIDVHGDFNIYSILRSEHLM